MTMVLLAFAALSIAALMLVLAVMSSAFGSRTASKVLDFVLPRPSRKLEALAERQWLLLEEFSTIEKSLSTRSQVIVLCEHVEQPSRELMAAVSDNFQQGIRYDFFVSNVGNSKPELEKYLGWFDHIFKASREIAPVEGVNSEIHNLEACPASVRVLPLAWSNVPYVFLVQPGADGEDASVLTYRGTIPGRGISPVYEKVEAIEARAILDLCSASSKDFREALPDVPINLDNVFPISPKAA